MSEFGVWRNSIFQGRLNQDYFVNIRTTELIFQYVRSTNM
jgi:hypothetical protein